MDNLVELNIVSMEHGYVGHFKMEIVFRINISVDLSKVKEYVDVGNIEM